VHTGAIYTVKNQLWLSHAWDERQGESLCDLAIICGPLNPDLANQRLAEMLHVDVDDWGFIKERGGLFDPAATAVEGVMVAGCASGPKGVRESVRDAAAAAAAVLSKLVPGEKLRLEPTTGHIDSELCSGCRLCSALCPYGALRYDPEQEVTRVVEEYCHGCGTCTAACPSSAASAHHFTDQQVYAELKGLLGTSTDAERREHGDETY
jgi:heterodisulfide reductase subunit A